MAYPSILTLIHLWVCLRKNDMKHRLHATITALILALFAFTMPAIALADAALDDTIIMPAPSYEPEEVVAIQLLGLQSTNGDYRSVAMQQVWAFAHPSNKAMTGPLPRFARLFDLPAYRPLLGHSTSTITRLAENDDIVQMQVQITGKDGQSYVYLWVVRRVISGPEAGSWMTASVSAPAGGGTRS